MQKLAPVQVQLVIEITERRPLHFTPQLSEWFASLRKSNIAVARLILNPRRNDFSPGFIMIPLTMRDPHGLAMLACIVTYTPGTVWVDLTPDHSLKLHVLDLQNEDDWVKLVQERYERPLMEMFE